jgi:tripartite ATP-independent transporter DctP family solute receptor
MGKFVVSVFVIGALVLVTAAASFGAPIVLRISTTSVAADWHTKALSAFKDAVEKAAPGQFDVQIYAGSSLIPANAEFGAMQRNSIQLCYKSAQDLVQAGMQELLPLTAGYVVKSPAQLSAIWSSPLGAKWASTIDSKFGFHVLGELYLGTRELNLRFTRKVMTPDDLKGVKLRMPDSPAWIFLGRAMGANPTPLAFSELYLALQTGTVDGQDNPMPTDRAAKFYEVTKQIVLTNHLVDGLLFIINNQTWNSLNPDQQKVIQDAARAAISFNDTNRLAEEKSLIEFFKSQGLDVYSPDVTAFRSHVLDTYLHDPISKDWPPNIIQQLDAIPVPASN